MIKMAKVDGIVMAMVWCDVCDKQIADLGLGAAVYRSSDTDTGSAMVIHAHKGNCHDQAEARVGTMDSAWQELDLHITDLLRTTGVSEKAMDAIETALEQR